MRAVMIEATLVSVLGSAMGVALGWLVSLIINWHYRGVYRTPLAFAVVTPGIVALAVVLSLVLAGRRLVRQPPLDLLTGRHEARRRTPAVA